MIQKIGIIGTGFGKHIAKSFGENTGCEVVGMCGRTFEKTERISQELQNELGNKIKPYDSWKTLVKERRIDLICIASPHILHAEMFFYAIKHGKHILLDKPADITSEGVYEMIRATTNYSGEIFINHGLRAHPVIKKIKKLILDNDLGRIMGINVSGYLNLFSKNENLNSWYRTDLKGGGQLLSYGIHLLDIARYLIGNEDIIDGKIIKGSFIKPYLGHDSNKFADSQFSGIFESISGIQINIFNTTYTQSLKDFKIEIFATNGTIMYSDKTGLHKSIDNQLFTKVEVNEDLSHMNLGSSIVTKSTKYLARDILSYLNNPISLCDVDHIANLKDSYLNLKYLEGNY